MRRGEKTKVSRPVLLTEPRAQEIAMPSGIVSDSIRTVGLEHPTEPEVKAQIKWAEANGLDPREVASPCLVNMRERVIIARHRLLDDERRMRLEADEIFSEERKHPLIVDPPKEICRG